MVVDEIDPRADPAGRQVLHGVDQVGEVPAQPVELPDDEHVALALTRLGPPDAPWQIDLGGGTVLAARLGHRESSDIDATIRNKADLDERGLLAERDLAARLGGTPLETSSHQLKIELADGVIDLNTAAVVPATGATTVEIDGRPQRVLSTTQILRGKLERAPRPAPVRDVYDMIRAAQDPTARENLIVAYALLTTEERDRIESTWVELDAHYEAEAGESLRLAEAPCTDLSMLGSTGARTLNDHRLARVVIETQPEMVLIERRTRNGRTIENTVEPARAAEKLRNLGTADHIQEHGGTIRRISEAIETAGRRGLSGVVFDTADDRPADRLDGRDTSRKRHHGPKPAGAEERTGARDPKTGPGGRGPERGTS